MTLFLFSGLNYFNRKIVHYDTILEYQQNLLLDEIIPGINFIPNDGITTSQIINHTIASFANGTAISSYLIVCDDEERIISRWWITENVYVRQGQSRLSLLRDVISDYYTYVTKSPAFIKKGYIGSVNDPAIYNNESLTFNQIKTKEYPIQDRSQCPWFIGYIDKSSGGENVTIADPRLSVIGEYTTLEDYPYYRYTNIDNPYLGDYIDITFRVNYTNYVAQGWDRYGNPKFPTYDSAGTLSSVYGSISTTVAKGFPIITDGRTETIDDALAYMMRTIRTTSYDWLANSYAITNVHTGTALDAFMEQEGANIKIGTTIYRVTFNQVTVSKKIDVDNTNIFAQKVRELAAVANEFSNTNIIRINDASGTWSAIEFVAQGYQVVLEPQDAQNIEYTLPVERSHCIDAPYDIIAIPAQTLFVSGDINYTTSRTLSQSIVDQLITTLGPKAYDWQLLPYCPFSNEAFDIEHYLKLNLLEETAYTEVGDSALRTIILYPSYSKFNKVSSNVVFDVPEDVVEFKIVNECNMYRLCSPNYNGQFEFSIAKNGGVRYWNISCAYKPFSPYIRVSPSFSRLYGSNFTDARGLVCGGDFSITQTSDAWINYEINNKNFQVMFDRQIQNMEVNNSVQRTLEKWNMATGSLQGATTGAMAGGMMGGPWAAVAGGVIGGAASLAGGAADRALNEKLRAEALDYAKDQFGYQLQNIKALPDSLTKVGAATNDYKYFPFVEVYTCSEVEKQALRDKIKWDGMTVMRIGTVADFLKQDEHVYIQAQLIRLERVQEGSTLYMIQEDSHVLQAISAELNTGVYMI